MIKSTFFFSPLSTCDPMAERTKIYDLYNREICKRIVNWKEKKGKSATEAFEQSLADSQPLIKSAVKSCRSLPNIYSVPPEQKQPSALSTHDLNTESLYD
jgi:hypothetical protein